MSLCADCLKVFRETVGTAGHKFTIIKAKRPRGEHSSRGTRIDGSTRIGE
jgi:hypothetical protein